MNFLVGYILALFSLLIFRFRSQSKMEHILATQHRSFLKSLKIDGFHKLPNIEIMEEEPQAAFSVEIDGIIESYAKMLKMKKLIDSLEDSELSELCERLNTLDCVVRYLLFFLIGIVGLTILESFVFKT